MEYTTTNGISCTNNSSILTYVCGSGGSDGLVAGSPVIYNSQN